MSLSGLLNQSITLYGKSSYDAYGRDVVGSGSTVKVRIQPKSARKLLPNGSVQIIDAIAYFPSDTTIATDDRIDHGSNKYKILSVYPVPDGQGNTHHQKAELIKWRQT